MNVATETKNEKDEYLLKLRETEKEACNIIIKMDINKKLFPINDTWFSQDVWAKIIFICQWLFRIALTFVLLYCLFIFNEYGEVAYIANLCMLIVALLTLICTAFGGFNLDYKLKNHLYTHKVEEKEYANELMAVLLSKRSKGIKVTIYKIIIEHKEDVYLNIYYH